MTERKKKLPAVIEVTVHRAAQLKKVSVRTIQRYCNEGKLVNIRNHETGSFRIFLPESEYESLKTALKIPSDSTK